MDKDAQNIFRPSLKNKFLVEIVGTFILVYAIASAATVYSDSGQLGVIGIGLVHALVLTAIVYAIGYRSGAQVNPAVTIGLLVAKKIGRKEAVVYIIAQIIGAVLAAAVATPVFNLDAHGVALVGEVPRGLPTPDLPDLDVFEQHYGTILAASAGLLLIGFSQTAGDARAFAARHHYRVDVDQESVAQGMANVAAGAFRGMPVSTSLSASSLNESAGARTPLASLVTGALVILTLVALAPLFSDLPKAVLGAIIIDAVVFGMIDIPELRRLRRVKPFDFWVAATAIVAVLSAGVLAGVVIGIALSLAWLVYVATTPELPLLGREPGTHVYRDARGHAGDETFPGLAMVRLDGGLFFATAEALEERIRALAQDADPPLRAVLLDMESVDFVDSQGAATLAEILDFTEGAGVGLRLARMKPAVAKVLASDGVLERLGEDRIHGSIPLAVEAELAADRG